MKRKPYVECLELAHQGKVRDTYDIPGHEELGLMVATDAVSTHNVVHKSFIPNKGYALTALSIHFVLNVLPNSIPHHIAAFGRKIYDYLPKDRSYPADLHLRAIIIKKVTVIDIEFIWRAYLAGSLWKDYYSKGIPNPYGLDLPAGLKLMSRFDEPKFTPTEKSATDDPLKSDAVAKNHPEATGMSNMVYAIGREYALKRGLDFIDFKCEIGRDKDGTFLLVDEWLNSDCCRIAESSLIKVGTMPPWMDKEIFREVAEKTWNGGQKTALEFSPEVVTQGSNQYKKAILMLTDLPLEQFQKEYLS